MINFATSDPLNLQPDDEFTVVDAVCAGDIVYFANIAPNRSELRTVDENEAQQVRDPMFRVERGEQNGTISLLSYNPRKPTTASNGERTMPETVQDKVSNHMEFLGFDVERQDAQLYAKHPTKPNIFIRFYNEGIILSTYYVCTDEAKQTPERLLKQINTLNEKTLATRFFLDSDHDIVLVAFCPGDYDKLLFARFVGYWDSDLGKMIASSEISEMLK